MGESGGLGLVEGPVSSRAAVTARWKAWVASGYWSAAAISRSRRVSGGRVLISCRWDRSRPGATATGSAGSGSRPAS